MAKKIPTFMLFHSPHCGHCKVVLPTFREAAELYENDPGILLAECNCVENRKTCETITTVKRYPTFAITYKQELIQIRIERNIETFKKQIEDLKSMDTSIPCRRHFNQSEEYPYFILSFDKSDSEACKELQQISKQFPGKENHFVLDKRSNSTELWLAYGKQMMFKWDGSTDRETIHKFAEDFLHPSFGNWSLAKEWSKIMFRDLGFLVYSEPETHIHYGDWYARELFADCAFAKIEFETFAKDYPEIQVNETQLPLLCILSRDRRKFSMFRRIRYNETMKQELVDILNGTYKPETEYDFKYYKEGVFSPILAESVMTATTPEAPMETPVVTVAPEPSATVAGQSEDSEFVEKMLLLGVFIGVVIVVVFCMKIRVIRNLRSVRRMRKGLQVTKKRLQKIFADAFHRKKKNPDLFL